MILFLNNKRNGQLLGYNQLLTCVTLVTAQAFPASSPFGLGLRQRNQKFQERRKQQPLPPLLQTTRTETPSRIFHE